MYPPIFKNTFPNKIAKLFLRKLLTIISAHKSTQCSRIGFINYQVVTNM